MRRIVEYLHARVRPTRYSNQKDVLYGERWKDLRMYLSRKYGIDGRDVTAILFDVFRYIEFEVLLGSGRFRVPLFGAFERREVARGEQDGGSTSDVVMRFTPSEEHPGPEIRVFRLR